MSKESTKAATETEAAHLEPTKAPITVGRIVHVYSGGGKWTGPRPGIVAASFPSPHANVNVFLDGLNDRAVLAEFRARADGNTLGSIPVYDPLSAEDRQRVALINGSGYWAEWPPRS